MRIYSGRSLYSVALVLAAASTVHAEQTAENDAGGGNVVFFDRHALDCGHRSLQSLRLFRPGPSTIAFDYQCQNHGELGGVERYTPANEDGGGNAVYLDRHGVDCEGTALQSLHLYRPTGNQMAYQYRCGEQPLLGVQDYYTPANDDGAGNATFLDRHDVSCPAGEVLSYLRLQRPTSNTIRYHYRCGQPELHLRPEQFLDSPDGRLRLLMQQDGNLVIYALGAGATWATGTSGSGAELTVMQADGNLVLYDAAGTPRWASHTAGNPGASLALQNDGNLVIRSTAGGVLWSSGSTLPNLDPVSNAQSALGSAGVGAGALSPYVGLFALQHAIVTLDPAGIASLPGPFSGGEAEVARVTGYFDPNSLATTHPAGELFGAVIDVAESLGMPNPVPVTVTVTLSGMGAVDVAVDAKVLDVWHHLGNVTPVLGTELIFNTLHLVPHLVMNPWEGLEYPVDAYGEAFLRPTGADPWLSITPQGTVALTEEGYDVTLGGELVGQCNVAPAPGLQCSGDWDVLGRGLFIAEHVDGQIGELHVTYSDGTVSGVEGSFGRGHINLPVPMAFEQGSVAADASQVSRWAISGRAQYGAGWFDVSGSIEPGGFGLSGTKGISTPVITGSTTLTVSSSSASAQFTGSLCGQYTEWFTEAICAWDIFNWFCDDVVHAVTHTVCSASVTAQVGTNGQVCTAITPIGNVCAQAF